MEVGFTVNNIVSFHRRLVGGHSEPHSPTNSERADSGVHPSLTHSPAISSNYIRNWDYVVYGLIVLVYKGKWQCYSWL